MKKFFRKTWRFFVSFILAAILRGYGMTIWETILIIATIVESIIYIKQKKK